MFSYVKERQYYADIIEQEQQKRIGSLSEQLNEEFMNLKITANMILQEMCIRDSSKAIVMPTNGMYLKITVMMTAGSSIR